MPENVEARDGAAADRSGHQVMDPDLARLWRNYKRHGDLEARERLILQFAPLVKYVAGRLSVGLMATVDHQDLVSYGMFGLIDAIERFELDRGVRFETYAIARIKGAIIDELRSIDWVPRAVRDNARRIEDALTSLEATLGHTPTEYELAEALDIDLSRLQDLLAQVSLTSLVALDESFVPEDEGESRAFVETLADPGAVDPQDRVESSELRVMLAEAINRLPERDRTVIGLYYFEGMTLAQIGEILGVTESRVSQLHTKAVLDLRAKLVRQRAAR